MKVAELYETGQIDKQGGIAYVIHRSLCFFGVFVSVETGCTIKMEISLVDCRNLLTGSFAIIIPSTD